MKPTPALSALAAAVILAGCATHSPYAFVHGDRWFKADMHSYSVIVLDVDGKSTTRNPAMVDPGMRAIRVQGPAVPGFRYGEARTLQLNVEPCMRYYLKAVKKNRLDPDFVPAVDYQEPIAGCRVE
jgi:hypothetical protein